MVDRSPSAARDRLLKHAGLLVLASAWILLGLFGHDPWKPDDATSVGIVERMLSSNEWLIPNLAGEPAVDKPPLFYWIAAASAKLFEGILPLHDGARVASGLFLAITLGLLSATARELYGRGQRWAPVLAFIGCVGLWDRAHQLAPDVALLSGIAASLYGFALSLRRPVAGGLALGTGLGVSFLAKGLLGPVWIVLTGALLLCFTHWRNRRYLLSVAVAVLAALPWVAVWPALLFVHSPALFDQWWGTQALSRLITFLQPGEQSEHLFYVKNLPWIAWPAWPLALWTLWTRSHGFNGGFFVPGIVLPLTMTIVIFVVLTLAADAKAVYVLPLLLPLSLLAAAEIDTLPRGFSGALDWFGILTFGLLAALVWWLWIDARLHGLIEPAAALFRDTKPGFVPPFSPLALALSLLLTVLWLALVRPARRSNRRAVLNWAVGITLVWGLYTTIWLPYLDSRKSYRPLVAALQKELPAGCLASRNLGEPQRASLDYFAGIVTRREEVAPQSNCPMLLVQVGRNDPDPSSDAAWEKIWEGARPGDDTEKFVLLRRRMARRVPARG